MDWGGTGERARDSPSDPGGPPAIKPDLALAQAGRIYRPGNLGRHSGGALWQVHAHDWRTLFTFIPPSPWAWLVLGINYLSGPVGDWVIFRRLWKIPIEGIFPLIKKMIGNQILLSYVGEVYFYDWARRNVKMGVLRSAR